MKLLKVALEKQDYTLAAHTIVYGLVKAKVDERNNANGKKRRPKGQPERS